MRALVAFLVAVGLASCGFGKFKSPLLSSRFCTPKANSGLTTSLFRQRKTQKVNVGQKVEEKTGGERGSLPFHLSCPVSSLASRYHKEFYDILLAFNLTLSILRLVLRWQRNLYQAQANSQF